VLNKLRSYFINFSSKHRWYWLFLFTHILCLDFMALLTPHTLLVLGWGYLHLDARLPAWQKNMCLFSGKSAAGIAYTKSAGKGPLMREAAVGWPQHNVHGLYPSCVHRWVKKQELTA
jgi:hypothetical protein